MTLDTGVGVRASAAGAWTDEQVTTVSRDTRRAKIEALSAARGGTVVITYITATRDGMEVLMAMDAIRPVFRHLQELPIGDAKPDIDLFIHSNGGEGIVPWRLVTLIREYANGFNVLVPNRAFSAATLTALGADKVIMHPMGMLGPTDPTTSNPFNPPNPQANGQVLGISVEDVASYIALVKDDVGIHHEDELIQAFSTLAEKVHPLALGNVKRSSLQSRMMGEKLLKRRGGQQMPAHEIEEIVQKLTSQLYFHGHPINRQEARDDVGLSFVEDAEPAVADAMWDLYSDYEVDMKLDVAFQPLQEALAKNPLPAPAPPPIALQPGMTVPLASAQATVQLDPLVNAYIESTARCDVHRSQLEVVMNRDHAGSLNANVAMLASGWTTE